MAEWEQVPNRTQLSAAQFATWGVRRLVEIVADLQEQVNRLEAVAHLHGEPKDAGFGLDS